MNHELQALDDKYRSRAYTDPAFYQKAQIIRRVLEELDREGALVGNKSYAALLVAAAVEEQTPENGEAHAWNIGFSAATREWLAQRANPHHPIARENPYERKP